MINLLNCDTADLLARKDLPAFDVVITDSPWSYRNEGARGVAANEYETQTMAMITSHHRLAFYAAAENAYCFVWCTFPKLGEWFTSFPASQSDTWIYKTGGAWGKTNGLGVGFHHRGDAEIWLTYTKGKPRPANGARSNLAESPYISAKRGRHSVKPSGALEDMILMGSGAVLDLYAGEDAAVAKVCRRLGREYWGAELDPERWRKSMQALGQGELF